MSWKRIADPYRRVEHVGVGVDAGYRIVRHWIVGRGWIVYFHEKRIGPAKDLEDAKDLVWEHARMILETNFFGGGDPDASLCLVGDQIVFKERRVVLGYKQYEIGETIPVFRGFKGTNKRSCVEIKFWNHAKFWLLGREKL